MMKDKAYRIGTLGKPHGMRGEIVFHFDDDIFDRADADCLFIEIDGLLVPFFIEEYRFRSDDTALMTFSGVDSETKAAELTGCDVYFPRQMADNGGADAPLSKAEIIGYNIVDGNTLQTVGVVKAVDDSTINTLLQVEAADGREILIPVSGGLVKDVDRKGHSITIDIPDGLLSLQ